MASHYDWLSIHLKSFFDQIGIDIDYHEGTIVAHGDKCYAYRDKWQEAGIPFPHGVAIYLACYFRPYSSEVRETKDGWVRVEEWVIGKYPNWKHLLAPIGEEYDY